MKNVPVDSSCSERTGITEVGTFNDKLNSKKPHTLKHKGGGRMKPTLVVTYDVDKLDKSTKEYICDLFINQMVKVALAHIDNKSEGNPKE